MKNLFTLLLLMITVFSFKGEAQTNANCTAGFSFTITGNTVNFTPAINTAHHYWKFGDGSFSSEVSPIHVYASAGNYTVKHIFYRSENGIAVCIDSIEKRIELQRPTISCNLQASFSFERDPLQSNKVIFKNLSTPTADIHLVKWSFGDGTFSSDFNVSHVYTTSGLYTVCLIVGKEANSTSCARDVCLKVQVQVPQLVVCNLTAYFAWHADISEFNKIHFNNLSQNFSAKDTIRWTFGDGSVSYDVNPNHVYANAGVYNVCIRIKKAGTTNCVKEYCKQVTVIKEAEVACEEISKFSVTRSTANCLEFKFTPEKINPNYKYTWSFGDGTNSITTSPSHVFLHSGNYTVVLTVSRSTNCVSTSHKIAETGNCFTCNNIWAKYEYRRESSSPNKIYFHAISNAPIQSQSWTVTKLTLAGTSPIVLTAISPSYTFEPGEYRVCLKVVTLGGCVKEYCSVINIPSPYNECNLTAYPNPAHNQVTVSLQLAQPVMMHLYIYNSVNNLLHHKEQQGNIGNNNITVNIESLLPGWYTIKVISGNRVCYIRFQKT